MVTCARPSGATRDDITTTEVASQSERLAVVNAVIHPTKNVTTATRKE
jgi:hypothetical protein